LSDQISISSLSKSCYSHIRELRCILDSKAASAIAASAKRKIIRKVAAVNDSLYRGQRASARFFWQLIDVTKFGRDRRHKGGGAINAGGVLKYCDFRPVNHCFSKTMHERGIVTYISRLLQSRMYTVFRKKHPLTFCFISLWVMC